MTKNVVPILGVAIDVGNSGNSGNSGNGGRVRAAVTPNLNVEVAAPMDDDPASVIYPGSKLAAVPVETDHSLIDFARDVMIDVLETTQKEEGVTIAANEAAVRVLLLAAAELWCTHGLFGRGQFISTALMTALEATVRDLTTPPADQVAKPVSAGPSPA